MGDIADKAFERVLLGAQRRPLALDLIRQPQQALVRVAPEIVLRRDARRKRLASKQRIHRLIKPSSVIFHIALHPPTSRPLPERNEGCHKRQKHHFHRYPIPYTFAT